MTTPYEEQKIPIATQAERVRHVVQCAFAGRRIVIFSGGAANFDDDALLGEMRAIHSGGGFGSILGRNSFQRPKSQALMSMSIIIAPSILVWIHADVMDGRFSDVVVQEAP
jgi:fructose-bisphosphate aldolase, class I